MLINDKYEYEVVKKKEKKKVNWPLIISFFSVGLSFTSFYFSNYVVRHSVKVSYNGIRADIINDTIFYEQQIVLQNYGKQSETILKIAWFYLSHKFDSKKDSSLSEQSFDTVIIIKPGEAISFYHKNYFPVPKSLMDRFVPQRLYLYYDFTLTSSKGIIYSETPVSWIALLEGRIHEYYQDLNNYELIDEEIEVGAKGY